MTGINFTTVRADHCADGASAMMPAVGSDHSLPRSVTKWCSECDDRGIHLRGTRQCFLNPYDDGRWPLSVASDAEHLRKLKVARAEGGKKYNLVPRNKAEPTAQEIKDFQIWKADRGGGRGGGKGWGRGRGAGAVAVAAVPRLPGSCLT